MSKKSDASEAIAVLREFIKPGQTLYTICSHTSRSGMQRSIKIIAMRDGEPVNISWRVAKAVGWSFDDGRDSVKVSGCGMDMGFHVVYTLGRTLFPDGGDLSLSPRERQGRRLGETKERDGGYLLKHTWL